MRFQLIQLILSQYYEKVNKSHELTESIIRRVKDDEAIYPAI